MAEDDGAVQISNWQWYSFLAPVRSQREVARIKGLAGVSKVARTVHEAHKLPPIETESARPMPAPMEEAHELLAPQTAASLNEMHAIEADLMIRAMIEAAKSDGKIDPEERRRILTCLKDAGATEPDRQALLAAMKGPPDLDGLVARVTSPELAVEVYAASLLAIKDDQPSEQHYLARLGQRLKLAPETIAEMHAQFGDPPPLPPEA
jgi:uncharacterized membrane protein YebE (DUF533 family)